jgi:hypothetical protein
MNWYDPCCVSGKIPVYIDVAQGDAEIVRVDFQKAFMQAKTWKTYLYSITTCAMIHRSLVDT